MKLYYAPASPFARKARLCAFAAGLTDRVELVEVTLSPVSPAAEVSARNPLGKVPALELDDETMLFDSRVIVEFFDLECDGALLASPTRHDRLAVLRLQALADGLLDAAVAARYELALRPPGMVWTDWVEAQKRKVLDALAALDAERMLIETGPPLCAIVAACALGYLDFRFADWAWRSKAPGLGRFFAAYAQRPEMVATAPAPGFQ